MPQSRMMSLPPLVRSETHEVLPPKRTVPGPGAGIEPRTPQNVSSISARPSEMSRPS